MYKLFPSHMLKTYIALVNTHDRDTILTLGLILAIVPFFFSSVHIVHTKYNSKVSGHVVLSPVNQEPQLISQIHPQWHVHDNIFKTDGNTNSHRVMWQYLPRGNVRFPPLTVCWQWNLSPNQRFLSLPSEQSIHAGLCNDSKCCTTISGNRGDRNPEGELLIEFVFTCCTYEANKTN